MDTRKTAAPPLTQSEGLRAGSRCCASRPGTRVVAGGMGRSGVCHSGMLALAFCLEHLPCSKSKSRPTDGITPSFQYYWSM